MLGANNPFLFDLIVVHSCHIQAVLVVSVTITPFSH